ncbi:MAG: squalene/phytoene synthase family protein [Prolixibacteraceae bacterium]|nr:squalene/phytoene synthase family protein [Prolixibacteraceae bacterium]
METTVQTDTYYQIFESIDFEKVVDHPNILIAAHFWDGERYQAARNCYKFMRAIDDLIDNYKTEHITIAPENQARFEADVYRWISTVVEASSEMPTHRELIDTVQRFCIPFWPLEAFAKSMIYDIYHDGFPTLQGFIDYAGGASVAPASIFVHLAGLRQSNGKYLPPLFDVKEVATPCAIFSYLVHIIRDFQKDHLNNLNYFPDDLIAKYGMNRQQLLFMAKGGQITDGFRSLIRELYEAADIYRERTLEMIRQIKPLVEPRSQLSLEIIFDLYLMVFERIDIEQGTFTSAELNPTWKEIRERVGMVIERFEAA